MNNQFFKKTLLALSFLLATGLTGYSQVVNAIGAPYTTTSSGSGSSTQPEQVLRLVQDHYAGGAAFLHTPSTIPHLRLQTKTEGLAVFPNPNPTTNIFQWDLQVNTEGTFQFLSETPTLQILDASTNTLLHQWKDGNYQAFGSIHATEVTVTDIASFPDYVFEENYELMSLKDVNQFIKTNKHLPNIPSAQEVETGGLHIGDLQIKQMEKIEELFLHVISLKSEMELLKEENEKLRKLVQSSAH